MTLLLLVYALAGAAVLHGLGLVRSLRSLFVHAGLAVVVGWALTGVATSFLLVAGAAGRPIEVLPVVALAAAAALAAGRRAAPLPEPRAPAESRVGGAVAAAAAALLAAYLLVHLRRALSTGANWWDAWAFWLPKAQSLYWFGGLDTGPGGFTSFAHPHYPPLVPALNALVFRLEGAADAAPLPAHEWALAVAALGAVAAALAPRVRPAVLWPCLLFLALVPNFGRLIGAMTGDLLVALAFAVAGVAALLWRLDGDRAWLALAALLLAAAALTKAEGLYLAVLLVLALAVIAPRSRQVWAGLAALAAAPVLAVVPWRVWLAVHDVPASGDFSAGSLLDPGFLVGRTERLTTALAELPWFFLAPELWLVALPVALAAGLVALRTARPAALLVLVLVPLSFVGLAGVYWISLPPVEWHLATSAARVPAGVVFFATAAVPLLLGGALEARGGGS